MAEKKMEILVAADGSDNSERAVIEAMKYAEIFDADVTILTVVKSIILDHYAYLEPPKKEENEKLEKAGKVILDESLKIFAGFEGEVETKLRKGNPADEILQEAEEGYDLIILGSRGLGVFSRSFLGSVSNKVLNHTDLNVLVVK